MPGSSSSVATTRTKVDRAAFLPASTDQVTFAEQFQLLYCFAERSVRDLWHRPLSVDMRDLPIHLDAAVQWLKHCHDSGQDSGVSWGYSLKGGWRASYRETSGYIANTFFDLANYRGDEDSRTRALEISNWLLSVQEKNGSVANPRYGSGGIVFDTGQVLQGLIRAYEETQRAEFLEAALAAGNWLVDVADSGKVWTKCTHNGVPHVYNARVAWKLLKLDQIHPDRAFKSVACANLDWAVSRQGNGWFHQCSFLPKQAPFTHTIAYAIRGLLESGLILDNNAYLDSAVTAAQAIKTYVRDDGFLPGQVDIYGVPTSHYSCLTGNCQMAIIWLKLFELTQDTSFYEAATKVLQYVMASQELWTDDLNVRGGIKGSQPVWGTYTRLSYPNWATKFFIDALISYDNVAL